VSGDEQRSLPPNPSRAPHIQVVDSGWGSACDCAKGGTESLIVVGRRTVKAGWPSARYPTGSGLVALRSSYIPGGQWSSFHGARYVGGSAPKRGAVGCGGFFKMSVNR